MPTITATEDNLLALVQAFMVSPPSDAVDLTNLETLVAAIQGNAPRLIAADQTSVQLAYGSYTATISGFSVALPVSDPGFGAALLAALESDASFSFAFDEGSMPVAGITAADGRVTLTAGPTTVLVVAEQATGLTQVLTLLQTFADAIPVLFGDDNVTDTQVSAALAALDPFNISETRVTSPPLDIAVRVASDSATLTLNGAALDIRGTFPTDLSEFLARLNATTDDPNQLFDFGTLIPDEIDARLGDGPVIVEFRELQGAGAPAYVIDGVTYDSVAVGTEQDDTFFDDSGTARLLLFAQAGDDSVSVEFGRGRFLLGDGNDTLNGTTGSDVALGGNGRDQLFGLLGGDTIDGGADRDTIGGGNGNDSLIGGAGDDSIFGGANYDTILAGDGNDTVAGDNGRDLVFLNRGNDLFIDNAQGGENGQDTVWAGFGKDTIEGGNGDDVFYGEWGADLINARLGNDMVFGGDQFDTINAGEGDDTVDGGNGRDLVFLAEGNDRYNDNGQGGELGRDTVFGGFGDDEIQGGNGDDEFHGQAGNDSIWGRLGDDLIYGGDNFDFIDAGDGQDTVFGGNGRDTILLGAGDDEYVDANQTGELGQDTITGGAGADRFVFGAIVSEDVITDFEMGVDTLALASALVGGRNLTDLAAITAAGLVLEFADGQSITLSGVTTMDGLAGSVDIV